MKTKAFSTLFAVLCMTPFLCSCSDNSPQTLHFFAMDIFVWVTKYGGDIETVIENIKSCSENLDMYSGTLCEANANTEIDNVQIYECSEKVISLNDKYGDGVDITSGALTSIWGISGENPRVPTNKEIQIAIETVGKDNLILDGEKIYKPVDTKLDFGAVAKGYACDKIYDAIKNTDVKCSIVSLGSSSLLYGNKPDGKKFSVDIRNPDGSDIPLGRLETDECFISTSGGYERFFQADGKKYCHILNTETGFPIESDLVSVTVICFGENGGITSDFLATDIFIGGTENLGKHLSASDYKIIAADNNGKIYVSDGLDFTPNKNSGYSL